MTECFGSSKYLQFYTIVSPFEDEANLSDKDNGYPVKFQYFANLFYEPRGTYFNQFYKDQELGLIKYNNVINLNVVIIL